jgi:hypothetical protein
MPIASRRRAFFVAVAASYLALAGAALAFEAVTLEDYSGAELFDRFFASCHAAKRTAMVPLPRRSTWPFRT